jgi:hypothetical protein
MSTKREGEDFAPDLMEIESLNIENLDVEELERRIELASGMPIDLGLWCDCNGNSCSCNTYTCTTYTCTTYCNDCTGLCGAYCDTDSGCTANLPLPI